MSTRERKIPIFVNRKKYEVEPGCLTAREILELVGLGEGYDLHLLSGERDPSGGRCLLADEKVEMKPGLHFRALPGNCTFGDVAGKGIPPLLEEHAAELAAAVGRKVFLSRDGARVLVVVETVPLTPKGVYSAAASDVLMLSDVQYPISAMDMFYMDEAVGYAGRAYPSHASQVEAHGGRRWRRWSWHRGGAWTPGADGLLSHWAFVEACWAKEARGEAPCR